jgi:hypothetical protein
MEQELVKKTTLSAVNGTGSNLNGARISKEKDYSCRCPALLTSLGKITL